MENSNLSPFFVVLLFILRCLVPLGIMLGISYLLRRFGLIKEPPRPPSKWNGDQNNNTNSLGGGELHG